jgi:hypothetical protein
MHSDHQDALNNMKMILKSLVNDMKSLPELIVYFDTQRLRLTSYILLIVIGIELFLLVSAYNYHLQEARFISLVLLIVVATIFCLFLTGLLYLWTLLYKDKPIIRMNKKEIWISYYGYLPWDFIDTINVYTPLYNSKTSYERSPYEIIGIRLTDTGLNYLPSQASWQGKLGLFWAYIGGYSYHIYVSFLSVSSEHIIAYANKYLQKSISN